MSSARGKILVIRGGAIGDFILTLPVLAALRGRFPEAHLEVLGYPHIVQLALAGRLVDRVQSIEARALAGFFARGGALDADLVDYFSEFDLIVSYLFDPDGAFQTNVGRCSPAQFLAGPHRPDETAKLHAAKVYLQPLERLAIFEADALPRLDLARNQEPGRADPAMAGPDAPFTPKAFGTGRVPTVALHPGSGSERKNWPESNWAELVARMLNTTTWHLLLVGGEAEGERLQRLAAALPPARVRVAQSLPLTELARRLQACDVFIGHDSGISHLAAALGLPSLVLWSDTAEEIWRPPHPHVVVLKGHAGLPTLRVETVARELRPLLVQTAEI